MRKTFLAVITLGLGLMVPASLDAQILTPGPSEITVGVVWDGRSPGDTLEQLIRAEVDALVAVSGRQVTYKSPPEFDAGWRADRMQAALRAALDDPEVDIVLTTGLLITQAATQIPLDKPVVSAFVQRSDLFHVADTDRDRSTKPNLVAQVIAGRVQSDIETLVELGMIGPVYIAAGQEYVEQLLSLDAEVEALARATGVAVTPLAISTDVPASVDALPGGVDVVFLAPTPRLSVDQRAEMIAALTQRSARTFSLAGHDEVEIGALAARSPDVATLSARRAALNLVELARGIPASDLPVLVSTDPRLLINGRTAVALGFRPGLQTLGYASFLHKEELELEGQPLNFAQTLRLAERSNLNLAIADRDVEIQRRQKDLARSPMLPQILAVSNLTAQRLGGLENILPDRLWSAGFRASQMVYDDRTISDFRSSSRLFESSRFLYQSERLDIFSQAGSAFYSLGLADIQYRIQLSYLRLSEENLELSRFREEVGYSGRDEVYRWESEVAQQRTRLFDRLGDLEAARIALNQLLAINQGTRWELQIEEVDPAAFPFLRGRFGDLFNSAQDMDRFRLFSVGLAIQNAPELASVDFATEAQQIQLGQRTRAWFLPSFFIEAAYQYQIERDPDPPGRSRDLPRVSLGATYPVFVGASRSYEVSQNRAAVERLERERRLTHDLIERQTRTAIRRLEASFPSIRFQREAAESARLNFDLVQEKYAQGLANVTDLFQAQTQSFIAAQGAAVAEFEFHLDLVEYQRAISWFEADKTTEQRQALSTQLQRALQ